MKRCRDCKHFERGENLGWSSEYVCKIPTRTGLMILGTIITCVQFKELCPDDKACDRYEELEK